MSKKTILSFLAGLSWFLLLFCACSVVTDTGNDSSGTGTSDANLPIDPADMVKMMGPGIDVSWAKTRSLAARYTPFEARSYSDAGFGHVRIRTDMNADDTLFSFLDGMISDCLDNGMVPVLAYKNEAWCQDPNSENLDGFINWWKIVAARYKDYSPKLVFNLIVELDGSSAASKDDGTLLNQAYELTVAAIRQTNPTRIIAIAPQKRGDPSRFANLRVPKEGNGCLIGEWHEGYASGPEPGNAKHGWDPPGTDEQKAMITDRIDMALDWTAETGIPTWEGAWMAGNYNSGNDYTVSEQCDFASSFLEQLKNAAIPAAINAGHWFWDYEKQDWIPGMTTLRDVITGNSY